MSAQHLSRRIVSFFVALLLLVGVGSLVLADDKPLKAAPPPPSCVQEKTEVSILQQEVNNYRTQVARLATAVDAIRAERDALKKAAEKPAKE